MEVSAYPHGQGACAVRLFAEYQNEFKDGDAVEVFVRTGPGTYVEFSETISTSGGGCPELRDSAIKEWLVRLGHLDKSGRRQWPDGHPLQFYLTRLSDGVYVLEEK
jgi:hypothetical protein